jgi:hypothetical protein
MNAKAVHLFALILSFCSFGCSTLTPAKLEKSFEGQWFNNQEAICLKNENSSRPWQLKYAVTERTCNGDELFVTVHDRGEVYSYDDLKNWKPEYVASIFLKTGDKYKLIKRLSIPEQEGPGYFLKPNIIWATSKDGDPEQLIQLTEVVYGTGHFKNEHIFRTHGTRINGHKLQDFTIEEVEFIPAWESFQDHFGPEEQIWKGESNILTDDGLLFSFPVWKDENKTMQPVGKITGTYKLEKNPGGAWKISMDTFKREPVKDEDWH